MKKEDRDHIRKKIREKIGEMELKIKDYKELSRPVSPENAIGRISRMEAINNKAVFEAALREALDRLKKLKEAESKVDSPDFGRCISCKGDIPLGRLMIMPESTRCVRCARM